MSGQLGFVATDDLPPSRGYPVFSAEDVDDLGLELCLKVWCRLNGFVEAEWIPEYMTWMRRRVAGPDTPEDA